MNNQIPAEAFPVGVFLREEMEARGWDDQDIIRRSPDGATALSMLMAVHVDSPNLLLDRDTAIALSRAFGVSEQYFINLDAAYRRWVHRN